MDPAGQDERLAGLLASRRWVEPREIDEARRVAADQGGRLATRLYERGALDLAAIANALGEVYGIPSAGPVRFTSVDETTTAHLPARAALFALAVPLKKRGELLEVAFVDPADEEAVGAVRRAVKGTVRALVAPEPLVYLVLKERYGLGRCPRHLGPLVEELARNRTAWETRRGAAPVPADPQEYLTTPMAGTGPSLPDEVVTSKLTPPRDAPLSPEEILYGQGSNEDPLGVAQEKLAAASGREVVIDAILEYCAGTLSAAVVVSREGPRFRAVAGSGALERAGFDVDAASPSLLNAASAGETGYLGAIPETRANAALFEAMLRRPPEVLFLPLSLRPGNELLLYADAGSDPLDPPLVERLRMLARRARQSLDAPR